MKGCVKGLARLRRLHLKTELFFKNVLPRMTQNQEEMQHADKMLVSDSRVLSLHAVFLSASVLLARLSLIRIKGKVSTAAVTLGNISLPVQVAHVRPLCYRCHGLHFPLTPI